MTTHKDEQGQQQDELQPLDIRCGLTLNATREDLGREVRRVWIECCEQAGVSKPSHLAPWEDMPEHDREVDRLIGEAVAKLVMANLSDDESPLLSQERERREAAEAKLAIVKECADKSIEASPTLPIRVDQMSPQEYAIYVAGAHFSGMASFLQGYLKDVNSTPAADLAKSLIPRLARAQVDVERYRGALESLTPGGSEFVNDPVACVAHVLERRRQQYALTAELQDEVTSLRQQLTTAENSLRVVTSQRDDARRCLDELETAAREEGQQLRQQLQAAQAEIQATYIALDMEGSEESISNLVHNREVVFGELLALIHGDGGHYQGEHGTLKAIVDAAEKVIALQSQLTEAQAAAKEAQGRAITGLQQRVGEWLKACFGSASGEPERSHRFLEEALELVQATGVTREEALQLVDYVFNRPVGEIEQEAGGVVTTLCALCNAHGVDLMGAAETELTRIWTKIDVIRAKQAAKPRNSPLPVGLPEATGGDDDV